VRDLSRGAASANLRSYYEGRWRGNPSTDERQTAIDKSIGQRNRTVQASCTSADRSLICSGQRLSHFFVAFLSFPWQTWRWCLKLRQGRFLPRFFLFIFRCHPVTWRTVRIAITVVGIVASARLRFLTRDYTGRGSFRKQLKVFLRRLLELQKVQQVEFYTLLSPNDITTMN